MGIKHNYGSFSLHGKFNKILRNPGKLILNLLSLLAQIKFPYNIIGNNSIFLQNITLSFCD